MGNLRRYLIAGVLVWLPVVVTVVILKFLIDLVDYSLLLLPDSWQPEQVVGFRVPGLGLLLSALVLLVTGMIVTNLLGRNMVRVWEGILARIPVVRAIYSASKQLTETLFSGTGKSFRKVVMVRFPHAGVWTLAFVTGEGMQEANAKTGKDLVNVFVPTTPNPTSGYFLMIPRDDILELDMSVDAGIKLILSAGAVLPDSAKSAGSSGR